MNGDYVCHSHWRKSSYSGVGNGNCVEVAHDGAGVAMRDSKEPVGSEMAVSTSAWHALLTGTNLRL